MSTLWLKSSEDATGEVAEGDIVLTPRDDVVQIDEVDSSGNLETCAEVAPSLLPHLPEGTQGLQPVDDEALLTAVRGIIAAERERGG